MTKISAPTLGIVSKKAKEFLREETEQSLLASVLLSISSLEIVLAYMLDLELKIALLNICNERIKKLESKKLLRGYNLDKIINKVSIRNGATLGEMIDHIEKYLAFPEKEELLNMLIIVNDTRNKVVHDTLKLYEKNSKPITYIRKLAQTISINADKAIDLSFAISERSSNTNLPEELLK